MKVHKANFFIFLVLTFSLLSGQGNYALANSQPQAPCSNILARIQKVTFINDGLDPEFKSTIAAENVVPFETLRQFPSKERVNQNAKVRILFTHGNGTSYSHSDSMRKLLRYFAEDTGEEYKGSSNMGRIRKYEKFTQASGEAIDLPGHGSGMSLEKLPNRSDTTEYLASYIKTMKAETPGMPFVLFTRSSSYVLFIDVVKKYPDLIDGFIFMSPTVPQKEWVIESAQKLREQSIKDNFGINEPGLQWIDSFLTNSVWDENTFQNKPLLILSGIEDYETRAEERVFYQNLVFKNRNIEYLAIPHAEHDVLRSNRNYKDPAILETMKRIQDFLFKFRR